VAYNTDLVDPLIQPPPSKTVLLTVVAATVVIFYHQFTDIDLLAIANPAYEYECTANECMHLPK